LKKCRIIRIEPCRASKQVGESPLYAACCSNSLEIIQLLINEGVDLNSTNQEGATALYISALNGNLEALFMLLEAGADVSIADNVRGYFFPLLTYCVHRLTFMC